ncbi:MAG: glycosyltransferase [Terrimicrobiaceae bacterium]|nr:glycosyltransferase [Terrimicrobiaceae bacterium]
MKILYVWNLYQQQGGENMWYPSEPELFRERGHEVCFYERDNSDLRSFGALQKVSMLWRTSWAEDTYREVRAMLRREKPDVVHVYNTLALVSGSIFHACAAEHVPVVQTLYNYRAVCPAATLLREGQVCEECVSDSLWSSVKHACYRDSRLQSAALAASIAFHRWIGTWERCVQAFIVPTAFMREKLSAGLPREKIEVRPNWHEPDPGMREGDGGGNLLYVGRLSEEKGARVVLETWARHPDLPPIRILGDGPLKDEIEDAARNDSRIEYLGRQPHERVISELRAAGGLLVPALWYEAFPHTLLEAAACGAPILGSHLGTLPDVVVDGQTGFLFDPFDPSDVASVIRRFFDSGTDRRAIQLAARQKYDSEFRGEQAYGNLTRIYQLAMARISQKTR